VFGNVFLHLHPVRTHRWSLRWSTTWGLGIAAISCLFVLVATGVLLMFYYKPYPEVAYLSIKDIHFVVPTGRFIRNIHRWSANMMVVIVLLHMGRVFYTAAYRAPREFNWVIGMGLLAVTLGLSFTGYLLPWNQRAYWATTVGTQIAGSVPMIGDFILKALRGGTDLSALTLQRFFSAHIWIVPVILAAFIGIHLYLIIRHGESHWPTKED